MDSQSRHIPFRPFATDQCGHAAIVRAHNLSNRGVHAENQLDNDFDATLAVGDSSRCTGPYSNDDSIRYVTDFDLTIPYSGHCNVETVAPGQLMMHTVGLEVDRALVCVDASYLQLGNCFFVQPTYPFLIRVRRMSSSNSTRAWFVATPVLSRPPLPKTTALA